MINEHSTIGFCTTDGSITEFEKITLKQNEGCKRTKDINKPFIIILNSTRPYDESTIKLRDELEAKYSVPVLNIDCAQMQIEDVNMIMERVLFEFQFVK